MGLVLLQGGPGNGRVIDVEEPFGIHCLRGQFDACDSAAENVTDDLVCGEYKPTGTVVDSNGGIIPVLKYKGVVAPH